MISILIYRFVIVIILNCNSRKAKYICPSIGSSLVCHLFRAKPLPEKMFVYWHLHSLEISMKIKKKTIHMFSVKFVHRLVSFSMLIYLLLGDMDFRNGIFSADLLISISRSSHDDGLRWMPWDIVEESSTLFQVIAWCCQQSEHYLSQYWPRAISPYRVTKPQCVNKNNTNVKPLGFITVISSPHLTSNWCTICY